MGNCMCKKDKKVKRVYKTIGSVTFMLVADLIAVILISILYPALNADVDNALIAWCVPLVIILLWVIIFGYLTPVRISSSGIKRNRTFISWSDLEIVLYPTAQGRALVYYIIWGDHDMDYKELRHKRLTGQSLVLLPKTITCLLEYYDKPIKIIDYDKRKYCKEGELIAYNKLKQIVNDHNAKYQQD